jgi:deazaflavin-dependent oxidoreductase (nitroreductase family)
MFDRRDVTRLGRDRAASVTSSRVAPALPLGDRRPAPRLSAAGSARNEPRGAPMSTSPADFNAKIIDEFHANEGRVGGMFDGIPLLLLHHTGAKSGRSFVNPLAYQSDGGRYVVFASKGGAPTNPAWYHNLKAHPNVTIDVGTATIDALATEATGEERERLFRAQAERVPQFAEYEAKTRRVIPVMILTPTRES